ncbi:MAG: flagellar export chaperone FliS [Burkholderiaceae bacterium]|nr:flagellar export chaperone FliS [Burkholderiaceae bacterium]
MTRYGQAAYQRVSLDTAVASADPHQMILMLFDGAIEAVRQATVFMQDGRAADKGRVLGKAIRIVEEGLKASLDRSVGGALAQQLAALYDYVSLRLLQANLRNDAAALQEVSRLLDDLRGAWVQIGKTNAAAAAKQAAAAPATAAAPAATPPAAPVPPQLAIIDGSAAAPLRRFAVSA